MPTGMIAPPPSPWTSRQTTSTPRLGAAPHAADAMVNTERATRKVRFRPKRFANQPVAGCDAQTARR